MRSSRRLLFCPIKFCKVSAINKNKYEHILIVSSLVINILLLNDSKITDLLSTSPQVTVFQHERLYF